MAPQSFRPTSSRWLRFLSYIPILYYEKAFDPFTLFWPRFVEGADAVLVERQPVSFAIKARMMRNHALLAAIVSWNTMRSLRGRRACRRRMERGLRLGEGCSWQVGRPRNCQRIRCDERRRRGLRCMRRPTHTQRCHGCRGRRRKPVPLAASGRPCPTPATSRSAPTARGQQAPYRRPHDRRRAIPHVAPTGSRRERRSCP